MVYPYIVGKNFIFRILVELGVGLFSFLLLDKFIFYKKITSLNSRLTQSLFLFLFSLFAADLFGANFYRSFWSNYSRMEGLITHIHLFLFFSLLVVTLNTMKRWGTLFHCIIFSSFVLSIVGLLQKFKIVNAVSFDRVDSMFGNPSYFSLYSALCFFVSLYFFNKKSTLKKYQVIYLVTAVLNIVSIYLTQTRSVLLAFICGLISITLFYRYWLNSLVEAKRFVKKTTIVLIVSFVVIVFLKYLIDQNIDIADRVATSSLTDKSIFSRLQFWNLSFEAFKTHPFLGWGQESFMYLSKFYSPQMWYEPWLDRAHNIIFDLLVDAGLFGLLAYFLIYLQVFLIIFKKEKKIVKKSNNEINFSHEKAFLVGGLVCYSINNLFIFDNITSYILFFSSLGFVNFINKSEKENSQIQVESIGQSKISYLNYFLFLCLISTMPLAIYFVNYKNMKANYDLRKSISNENLFIFDKQNKLKLSIQDILERKLFANSEVREQLVVLATQVINQPIDLSTKNYIFKLADTEVKDELQNDPQNTFLNLNAGYFYLNYNDFNEAEKLLQKALQQSKDNQYVIFALVKLNLRKQNYRQALVYSRQAFNLEPSFPDAQMYLAISLIFSGQFGEADQIVEGLKQKKLNQVYDTQLIEAYFLKNQASQAIALFNLKRRDFLVNENDCMLTARYFLGQKNRPEAIRYYQMAVQINPQLKSSIEKELAN